MEACSSAHYWARKLQTMGHTVRLMAPQTVSILKEHSTDCSGNQDVMARRSDHGRSNLIYTGSIKLDRLIRHLPAYSIRDRGCGLDHKSGSMAAIFTCSHHRLKAWQNRGDHLCVKTQPKTGPRKIDASERAILNDLPLENSKRIPENILTLRFYTAWTYYRHSAPM